MGRKVKWPPKVLSHSSGQDRVLWRGRAYYLGKSGTPESRAAYVELIKKLQAEGEGQESGPATGTVAQVVALWTIHASTECSPEEVVNYRVALRPVVELYGTRRVAEFDALALRRAQQHMATLGWRRNFINRAIIRVRTVWRWAEMEQLVGAGTWAALRAVPPLGRPRQGLTESPRVQPVEWWRAARTAFLGSAPGLRLWILLAWWTGARPDELACLTGSMIDQETWSARLDAHKNAWRNQERVLYFGPESQALLVERLASLSASTDLICPDGNGDRFNRRSLYQALGRACKRAGVERFHLYQLRHAFRVRVSRLVGMDGARALMGHRSIDTTSRYGIDGDGRLAIEAARKAG